MNEADRKALTENRAWLDFRDWIKATVELENRRVVEDLDDPRLEKRQGRRDAFEDVWKMVLAFEEEGRG